MSPTVASEPRVADIRPRWLDVRSGINEILASDPQTWTAEDVYDECLSGDALYIESPNGFVVALVKVDPFSRERTLYIWLAYAWNRGMNLVTEYDGYFRSLAKYLQCSYIEVDTAVEGVYKYLHGLGWQLKSYNLVKDLHGQRTGQV